MGNIKKFFSSSLIVFLTLGCSISLQSLLAAWTGPTTNPPGDNASGAINIGSIGQSKIGGLILNTGGSTNGLIVHSGKVGIGTVAPNEVLTVNGVISLAESSTTPAVSSGFGKLYAKYFSSPSDDSYTKLLLHAEGTGSSFIDSSSGNHPVNAIGNSFQSTLDYKFGGKSASFDGSGDYLSIPDSDDWNLSNGDFTIDFWGKLGNTSGYIGGIGQSMSWRVDVSNSYFQFSAASNDYTKSGLSLGTTWHHFAVVRSGNNLYKFLDGGLIDTTSFSATITNSTNNLFVGVTPRMDNNSYYHDNLGYIDELRISKGIARWTSNFIPPSSAYSSSGYAPFYKDSQGNETQLAGNGGAVVSSLWGQSGNNIYYLVGNVGIGKNNPSQKLDVNGAIAANGSTVIDSTGNWQGNPIASSKIIEADPKIGTISNGSWCAGSGGQVVCNQSAPSAPSVSLSCQTKVTNGSSYNQNSPSCDSGYTLTGGGCYGGGGSNYVSYSYPVSSYWSCQFNSNNTSNTAYAICCKTN